MGTDRHSTPATGMNPGRKYAPYLSRFSVPLADRQWPSRSIDKAPIWCSVDLRDGNQALINPMSLEQKKEFFALLVKLGFKEIEIGFPSAAAVEFQFARCLIEDGLLPADVVPQVLTQARDHLIQRTFESLRGAPRAIVHLYNSTSEAQRRLVFRKGMDEIVSLAVEGTRLVRSLAADTDTEVIFEYSPESFTGTELEFAREVCERVAEAWQPTASKKMILNLPATVEMITPNVYADQIEWMHRNLSCRKEVILSLHTHNDRGTGVAASELGLLAGADRVEGTLFGNGERTGNVDIVTLALNLYSQGVDPGLVLDNIDEVREITERCTDIPVPARHPYAGELVFTAFSGSHQDAIRKGMMNWNGDRTQLWDVPYLPIDPLDIGRKYEAIVRINSQSGKGGIAYRMETDFGFTLPKPMHAEFSAVIQRISDTTGLEVTGKQIWEAFCETYLQRETPLKLVRFRSYPHTESGRKGEGEHEQVQAEVELHTAEGIVTYAGIGNGPIDACRIALVKGGVADFKVTDYAQHTLSVGSDAEAAAYLQIERPDKKRFYGVGQDPNTTTASIRALICAVNRALSE